MGRLLLASLLAASLGFGQVLVLQRATVWLLSTSGSLRGFFFSTMALRLGSVFLVSVVLVLGGAGPALAAIAGFWCARTALLVLTLFGRTY
jgi:hypothetical protein